MPTQRLLRTLTIAATLSLCACGFQLRGSTQNALPFSAMYLSLPDTSSLGNELKRNIRANGTTLIVDEPKTAQAILDILSESKEKIILSLNSQGRVREYALYYRLTFRVKNNQDKELLPATEIVLKRSISFNESQVIAKEKEEDLLYRDMQTDLIQQIVRRLAMLTVD